VLTNDNNDNNDDNNNNDDDSECISRSPLHVVMVTLSVDQALEYHTAHPLI